MDDLITPRTELEIRISKLQALMQRHELDSILVLQQADKFYFSGTVQDGVICIPQDGEPVFMVRKSLERAKEESSLNVMVPFRSYKQIPDILKDNNVPSPKKMALELDVMPVGIFRRLQSVFSDAEISDASNLIREIRMVKSAHELRQMKKAGSILGLAMEAVPGLLRVGMSEIELAAETELILRKGGHQGIIRMRKWNQECFYGLILSGVSGAISNYMDAPLGGTGPTPAAPRGASHKKIESGEPIIIDMVSAYGGYVVDCTRTFYIDGMDPNLLEAFELSLDIQKKIIEKFRSGVNLKDIYDLGRSLAREGGFGENFMGFGKNNVKFMGHGVGLELDELPVIAEGFDFTLKNNMTLALEPKFLFPEIGAVGVENTWASSDEGPKKISNIADNLML